MKPAVLIAGAACVPVFRILRVTMIRVGIDNWMIRKRSDISKIPSPSRSPLWCGGSPLASPSPLRKERKEGKECWNWNWRQHKQRPKMNDFPQCEAGWGGRINEENQKWLQQGFKWNTQQYTQDWREKDKIVNKINNDNKESAIKTWICNETPKWM